MSDAESSEDRCAVATNAAMEVAIDECSEDGLLSNLSRLVGLEEPPERDETPDELSAADCLDGSIVKAWVAIRAEELIDDDEGLSDAIEQAWDESRDACGR
mgnify:CR=1 FL=1